MNDSNTSGGEERGTPHRSTGRTSRDGSRRSVSPGCHSPTTTTTSNTKRQHHGDDDLRSRDTSPPPRWTSPAHQRVATSSLVSYRPYINKEEDEELAARRREGAIDRLRHDLRQEQMVSSSTSDRRMNGDRHRRMSPAPHHDNHDSRNHHRSGESGDSTTSHRDRSPLRSPLRSPTTSRAEHILGPHATSPPNVTVLQPSVTHPMFSYLYPNGAAYPGATPAVPFPLNPLMFNNSFSHHHTSGGPPPASLPFGFPSSAAAAAAVAEMSSGAPTVGNLTHSMLLNGQLQAMAASQHLWSHAYPPGASGAAGLHHTGGASSQSTASPSALDPNNPHALYAQRAAALSAAAAAGHRYSPYALPTTKTTMVTTDTPAMSIDSHDHLASPGGSGRSNSGSPHSPVRSGGSPHPTTHTAKPTSELKNIERMVNGLEKQQEQIVTDSLAKLEK